MKGVKMERYICVDIGGTSIKHGLIGADGEFVEKGSLDTQARKGAGHILERVSKVVENYLAENKISGLCISTAGIVDPLSGEIIHANANIPDYTGTGLKDYFQRRFGIPCEAENDVNCAGIAEAVSGAAADKRIALCMTIGTGVGGCLLIDKEVFHGACNCACEVGYLQLRKGNLEPEGTAGMLAQRTAEKKGEPVGWWNGKKVLDGAGKQDKDCLEALDHLAEILGIGIANICYVVNPEVVVLGGGIMSREYEELLCPRIRRAMDEHLIPLIAGQTELRMAAHRNEAGMLGAFYHFLRRRGQWEAAPLLGNGVEPH